MMKRDLSVPTTQRCALLDLLSERRIPFSARLKVFEPMENMTDEEKETYAEETIRQIRDGKLDLGGPQEPERIT